MINRITIHQTLFPFTKRSDGKSIKQFLFTLIPLAFLYFFFFLSYGNHYWLVLLLSPIATAYLARLFIVLHDCGHGSYFNNPKLNLLVGYLTGFIFFTPFPLWKYIHARHHAFHGNIDKREDNPDIHTLTVEEYLSLNGFKKMIYRLFRSSSMWFLLAGNLIFLISFRIPQKKFGAQGNIALIVFNLLYVCLFYALSTYIPLIDIAKIYLPSFIMVAALGGWLFYIQHQFEDTYWERNENWSFEEVGLKGSSHYDLPPFLHWVTGNIGFHHVHHLNSKIPNYHLQEASEALDKIGVKKRLIHFKDSFSSIKLKVWDEQKKN